MLHRLMVDTMWNHREIKWALRFGDAVYLINSTILIMLRTPSVSNVKQVKREVEFKSPLPFEIRSCAIVMQLHVSMMLLERFPKKRAQPFRATEHFYPGLNTKKSTILPCSWNLINCSNSKAEGNRGICTGELASPRRKVCDRVFMSHLQLRGFNLIHWWIKDCLMMVLLIP